MDINRIIANNIKRLREERGITQKELAEALNFTNPSTIQKWEVGKNRVYIEYIYELAKIFGIQMEDFLVDRDKDVLDILKSRVMFTNEELPESIVYVGLDNVLDGYFKYKMELRDNLVIDPTIDRDHYELELKRTVMWEEENTFFFLFDRETEEVYGIRDYGRYYPDSSDFLFKTDFVPFILPTEPFYIDSSEMDNLTDKFEDMSEEAWKKKWENMITEKVPDIKKRLEEELIKYKKASMDGKTTLFACKNEGKGITECIDIPNKKSYMIEKLAANEHPFYYRPSDEYFEEVSEPVPGEEKFTIYFPDPLLMSDMGIFDMPENLDDMPARDENLMSSHTMDEVYNTYIELFSSNKDRRI